MEEFIEKIEQRNLESAKELRDIATRISWGFCGIDCAALANNLRNIADGLTAIKYRGDGKPKDI